MIWDLGDRRCGPVHVVILASVAAYQVWSTQAGRSRTGFGYRHDPGKKLNRYCDVRYISFNLGPHTTPFLRLQVNVVGEVPMYLRRFSRTAQQLTALLAEQIVSHACSLAEKNKTHIPERSRLHGAYQHGVGQRKQGQRPML